jgi:peptidoglycan/xylan/chitin deacetylase (PgdA/CDA1 family)
MSLSKKTKIFIVSLIAIILLVAGYFYFTKSQEINYDESDKLVVNQLLSEDQKAEVINTIPKTKVETIGNYKVDKNFNVVPTDPNGNKKVVLLTIDDGPSKQSENLMAILADHNVKAIFFINGNNDKGNPGVIKKEYDAGHAIGNHTWSHQNLKQISDDKAIKEIDSTTKLIADITGSNPRFFRSPFGISSEFSRAHLEKENIISMNWSASTLDWEKSARDKKVFVNNVMKDLHPGAIILMHEHEWDVNALPDLILAIKEKGYTFLDPKYITQ